MLTWSTVHMYIQYNRKECNLLHQSFCPASWRIQPVNLCHIWRLNSAQWWENYKCDLAANAHTASPLNHVISVVPMKMGWSACLVPRSSLAQNFCLGMKLIGRGLLLWQEAHICSGELIGTPEWKQEYGGRWRGGWRGGWPESLTMKFITNKVNILLTIHYKRHKIWNYLWLKYSLFSRLPLCQQNSCFFLYGKLGRVCRGGRVRSARHRLRF